VLLHHHETTPWGKTIAIVPLSSSWCTMCCTKAKSALLDGASFPCRETVVVHKQRTGRPISRKRGLAASKRMSKCSGRSKVSSFLISKRL
jgi:hypothetical protein